MGWMGWMAVGYVSLTFLGEHQSLPPLVNTHTRIHTHTHTPTPHNHQRCSTTPHAHTNTTPVSSLFISFFVKAVAFQLTVHWYKWYPGKAGRSGAIECNCPWYFLIVDKRFELANGVSSGEGKPQPSIWGCGESFRSHQPIPKFHC